MNDINEYADEMMRVYGFKVYRALHDSQLRGDVLIFFKINPFYMATSHVSKSMRVDYSNIKRVIDGDGKHYAKDKGLYALRLLDRKKTVDGNVYSINFEGFHAAKILEKEREEHTSGLLTTN